MITRRTLQLNFFSWKSWMKLSNTKILSIWIFIDRYAPPLVPGPRISDLLCQCSWLFLVFAGMLLFGVGTSTNT